MILKLLRRIFDSSYVDNKVERIKDENKKVFDNTAKEVKRHTDSFRKDDVMLHIYIVMGGKHEH